MLFYKEEKVSKRNAVLNAWQSKMAVFLRTNFSLVAQRMHYLYNCREEKPFFLCKPECSDFEKK